MVSTNNNNEEDAIITGQSPDESSDDEDAITKNLSPNGGSYYYCVFHLSMDAFKKSVIPNTLFAEFVAHKEDVAPNLLYHQFVDRWYKPSNNVPFDHHKAWKAYEDFMKNRWVFQGLILTYERPDTEVGKIFEAFQFFNDSELFGNRFYAIKTRKYLGKKRSFIRYASFVYEKLNQQWKLLSSFGGAPPSTFVLPDAVKHARKYLKANPNAPLPIQDCSDKEEVLDIIYFLEEESEEDYRTKDYRTKKEEPEQDDDHESSTKKTRGVGKYSNVASLKHGDDEEQNKKRSKSDSDDDDEGDVAREQSTSKRSKLRAYLKNHDGWKFLDGVERASDGNLTFVGYFHDGEDTLELKASLKKDDDQEGTVEEAAAPTSKTRKREKLFTFFDKQVRRFFEFTED